VISSVNARDKGLLCVLSVPTAQVQSKRMTEINVRPGRLTENESSRERTFVGANTLWEFQGAKVAGSERARKRKFQGANAPGSYWSIRSWEQIGPGAKTLWITESPL